MKDDTTRMARVIALSSRRAAPAPMTFDVESLPQSEVANQVSHPRLSKPLRNAEPVMVEAQRPFPYVRVAAMAALISVLSLVIGGLIGPATAVYVGILLSFIGLLAAHGLNVRDRQRRLSQIDNEELDPRPLALLNPANLLKLGMGWYVPTGNNDNTKKTLAFVAPAPCEALGDVVKVTVKSARVPAGIKYYTAKFVPQSSDGVAISCLMLYDDDRFGRAYHDKLREDLLGGDIETLDAELELSNGSVVSLEDIERFRSVR